MSKEEIKSKYFSCIYCLTPEIKYDPLSEPFILTTKCFKNHEIKYNIKDYINFRKEQFNYLENITCDKCASRKNLSFWSEDKLLLCQKCFPRMQKKKNNIIQYVNKIDKCPTHNKDYFYCKECKIIYCQKCDESNGGHKPHKLSLIKDFFLSENEIIRMQYIVSELAQYNFDLKFEIFNTVSNKYKSFYEKIYDIRGDEISLYQIISNEYLRRFNKNNSYNVLFNIRNLILNKYENIRELSYTDFISETKIKEENYKNELINYLNKNYVNVGHDSYNDDKNISILKDESNKNMNIKQILLLKNGNIFIASNATCYIYDKFMKLKSEIKLKDLNEQNINDKYQNISYIHYKRYNNNENIETVYAFITSTIYEINLEINSNNEIIYNLKEYNCKRISYKIDGVIDMPNGDIITCSHMYPVICWRKNTSGSGSGNFYEYKILSSEKPYIKNAINILHLPHDEFVFSSNSWVYLNFHKYQPTNKDDKSDYILVKDIRMNCSSKKNTLALYKNEILIVGIERDEIYLLDIKSKEIFSRIKGIEIMYMFVASCGDVIIKQKLQNYEYGPVMNMYKFENGEFLFKGVLKNKLQIYVQQICENEKGDLYIVGNELDFKGTESRIDKIYLYSNEIKN